MSKQSIHATLSLHLTDLPLPFLSTQCTFSACDSSGSCSPGVMSITVLPVASAIEETTAVEQAVSIPLGELYDFQHTTVEVHFDPADGVLDTSIATSLVYTPNAGFEGTEVLKYSLCTIATPVLCDESTISIVVEAVSADLLSNAESGESEEGTTSESFSSNKVAMGFVAVLGSTIVVAAVLVTMRDRGATAGEKFDENKHWWKTIHRQARFQMRPDWDWLILSPLRWTRHPVTKSR